MVFQAIRNQDLADLKHYEKVHRALYKFIQEFFKKNMELVFLKFEQDTIKYVIEGVLIPGLQTDSYEIKSGSLSTIDAFNEFVFLNVQKPSKKRPQLYANLHSFLAQNRALLYYTLRRIAITLLFEDHRNVWVFARCLHSTIVLCELGQTQDRAVELRCHATWTIFEEVIETFEKSPER